MSRHSEFDRRHASPRTVRARRAIAATASVLAVVTCAVAVGGMLGWDEITESYQLEIGALAVGVALLTMSVTLWTLARRRLVIGTTAAFVIVAVFGLLWSGLSLSARWEQDGACDCAPLNKHEYRTHCDGHGDWGPSWAQHMSCREVDAALDKAATHLNSHRNATYASSLQATGWSVRDLGGCCTQRLLVTRRRSDERFIVYT